MRHHPLISANSCHIKRTAQFSVRKTKGEYLLRKVELRSILAVVFVFLVVSLVFAPDQGLAAEVWSDDFNRENLGTDWPAQEHVTIDDGKLRATEAGGSTYHLSTVSVGTWSFDVVDLGEFEPLLKGLFVYFMCCDPGAPDESCYAMEIYLTGKAEGYKYVYYLSRNQTRIASHDGMEGVDLKGTLHHMDISRTESGVIRVFLNDSLIIQETDTLIDTSECFKVVFGWDFAIDNLVVDDVYMEAGVPPEIIAIVLGGAGVIIVAVVVFLRRR